MGTKQFTVDARTILTLGRDSIKDHTTALVELVKNSYDADATNVEIEIMTQVPEPFLRIADNGHGMTEQVIDDHWLRIGYSQKTTQKISKKQRRRTGEKGIGRISADRLGSELELHTIAEGMPPFGLRVCWDDFDVHGRSLENVPLHVLSEFDSTLPDLPDGTPAQSGTELIIKKLRQQWTPQDIDVLERELSVLISPFTEVADFSLHIQTDVIEDYIQNIGEQINENYVLRLDVTYEQPDQEITYKVTRRNSQKTGEKLSSEHTIHLKKLMSLNNEERDQLDFEFGPVSVTFIFYLIKADIVAGTNISVADLRHYMQTHSGIGLYRDQVRVKPYGITGASEWDWLGLGGRAVRSPAGPGRSSYRIGPNQIVGAVFVSRDTNPKLTDSSSREGLIQGPAFLALKRLLLGCVTLLENQYREVFQEEKQQQETHTRPSHEIRTLGQDLQSLQHTLNTIRHSVPANVSHDIERIAEHIEIAQKSIEELATQATIYRGLASLGIAASVFSHETQLALAGLTGAVNNAEKFLRTTPPKLERTLGSLQQANHFTNQVTSWGIFALERVRRDKRRRRKVNIRELILDVVHNLEPALHAVHIDLQCQDMDDIETRTFAMDIESSVLNLLTNAYTACKQKQSERVIRIQLKHEQENDVSGYAIVVSDSGPGIDPTFSEHIWDPLFTTKQTEAQHNGHSPNGTGLGLTIVDSVVQELGGSRSVSKDPDLAGARFRLWFPLQEK